MAEQMNTQAVDLTTVNTRREEYRKLLLDLLGAIRVDDAPESDRERLAGEGKVYPLTVDKNGYLRVALPADQKIETRPTEAESRMIGLLEEIRNFLMEIA